MVNGSGPDFSQFTGKLVKVLFREEPGGPVVIRKGIMVGAPGEFVELRTHENTHLINLHNIVAVKVFGEGLGEGRKNAGGGSG
jgi:hypothetical protein